MTYQDTLSAALKNGKITRAQHGFFSKCNLEYDSGSSKTMTFENTTKNPVEEIHKPFENVVFRIVSSPRPGILSGFTNRYILSIY